jgi:hypothetical protein
MGRMPGGWAFTLYQSVVNYDSLFEQFIGTINRNPPAILRSMPLDPDIFYRVSRLYQSRGCGGNVFGISGTLNWRSSVRICRSLRTEGRTVMDFGSGNGRFMAMALTSGARRVLGCEHPQNHAQHFIFCAVLEEMVLDWDGFGLIGLDIENFLFDIDEVHCPGLLFYVFTFNAYSLVFFVDS